MKVFSLFLVPPLAVCLGIKLETRDVNTSLTPNVFSNFTANVKKTFAKEKEDMDKPVEKSIQERMTEIVMGDDTLIGKLCDNAVESRACETNVVLYLDNCRRNHCFNIGSEMHPFNTKNANIQLPNLYQLEAAFYLFGTFISDYRPLNGVKKAKLSSREESNFYRIFLKALVKHNLEFPATVKNPERFLSRYLYLATLYYKAYVNIEKKKAKAQNMSKMARYIFAGRIKRTLAHIVIRSAKGDAKDTPVRYIVENSSDFADYLDLQKPGLTVFSKYFANMTVEILVNTLGILVIQSKKSLYKRFTGLLMTVLKKIIPFPENPLKVLKRMITRKNSGYEYENFVEAVKNMS